MNRKKIFFVLIGVVIIIGTFFAYNNIISKSKLPPKLVLSEEEWDFGKVKPNSKPSHTFILTNKGGKALFIDRVRVSCGCIKTSLSTDKILSGKSAELSVTFDTTGYEGTIGKAIYINTNDEKESEKKIRVIIDVEHLTKPKIKVSKDLWELGLISEGDVRTFKGEIENIGDADLIIDNMVIFDNIEHNFTLPLTILPNDEFEFVLIYDFTGHKLGEVREAIRFHCNDSKNETFFITVSGYIKEREISGIIISPEEITFNLDSNPESEVIEEFNIENSSDRDLKIISASTSTNYLTLLYPEFDLKSGIKENLQVVLLKDKVREEIIEEGTEEYIYITIALPIKIRK